MAGRISDRDIAAIRDRARIEDIVGDYVALKRGGADSLKGLCPFHDEKSPSFHVRPNHGHFHCFGCGEGGDVYSFLQKIEHVSFVEAVEQLAERVGYTLNYEGGGPSVQRDRGTRARLVAANAAAQEFYAEQLRTPGAQAARDYLTERNFDSAAAPTALRFATCGCQSWDDGYYTAYRHLAREELAFVYHYGDYIYEYRQGATRAGRGGGLSVANRQTVGQTLYDLADYRRRYALYKSDPDLQRAHAAHAFFHSFDDHEVADNWVQDLHGDDPRDVFRLRRAAALQAWYEHMPVRRAQMPRWGEVAMNRSVRYGNLIEMDILDTRQFRSDQPCNDAWAAVCDEVNDRNATVLGAEQEAWLVRNLSRRDARWNCLAQQIMMMSLDRRTRDEPARIVNPDSWAAYEVPRQRLLNRMRGLGNVVVLTGDEHQNFAGLLHDRDTPVAVEFVSTSISSGGDGSDLRPGSDRILANNPQLKFINDQRGYLTFDVTPDEWRTNYMVMDRVSTPGGSISKRTTMAVSRGTADLRQV